MELLNVYPRGLEMIWLLTALGAILRFYRLPATLQFLGDQGRDALVLKDMIVNFDLPFIGPITSVGGFYLGPLYYWLMAPFLWLGRLNPAAPALATAAIGVITIPVLYFVAKKLFSHSAGLWAAGLYAVSAIPVIETRGMWNPNPMPLAALGILYGFYLTNYQKKPKGLLLAAISLGAALQFHYMIVFLAPLILWQVIKARKYTRELLMGVGILGLMMLPLVLFEIKNNWLNIKGLLEFFGKRQYTSVNLWLIVKNTVGRSEQVIGMVLGFGRSFSPLRSWITRAFLLGLVWLLYKKRQPVLILTIVWLLSSIATLAVYQDNVYPHYLGFLFPVVFMLAGLILSQLKNWLMPLAFIFVLLFSVANVPQLKTALSATGNLKSVQTTARFILDDVNANQYSNYNLTLIDETRDYRAQAFRYFVEVYGGKPLGEADYPQTQVLYVVSPYIQTDILSRENWEVSSLKPASLVQAWEFTGSENIYKLIRL